MASDQGQHDQGETLTPEVATHDRHPWHLVGRARIRVYSGARGHSKHPLAEGMVVGYSEAPTLLIRHDDGTQSSWPITLPRDVVKTYPDSGSFSADLPAPAEGRAQPGDDGRRAAQIRAAGDYLRSIAFDLAYEENLAGLVDAVNAAGREQATAEAIGLPPHNVNSPLNIALRAAGQAGVVPWIGEDGRWRIEVHQDQVAEMVGAVSLDREARGRAAGYRDAITHLRDDELRERLAAIEHERWAHWQRWMHDACTINGDGTLTIPANLVERWERQIATPYADLSSHEKDSDRDQVARYVPTLADYLEAVGPGHEDQKLTEENDG